MKKNTIFLLLSFCLLPVFLMGGKKEDDLAKVEVLKSAIKTLVDSNDPSHTKIEGINKILEPYSISHPSELEKYLKNVLQKNYAGIIANRIQENAIALFSKPLDFPEVRLALADHNKSIKALTQYKTSIDLYIKGVRESRTTAYTNRLYPQLLSGYIESLLAYAARNAIIPGNSPLLTQPVSIEPLIREFDSQLQYLSFAMSQRGQRH